MSFEFQLQVFKTPSIIVKRYRIEPKSTDSLSNITSDQNSTAPINERIFTPSHVFIKSNPFFKTKSTSLVSRPIHAFTPSWAQTCIA